MAEALNATFFAFRKRERGGVLTMLTLTFAVIAVVCVGGFFWLNWSAFSDYMQWAMSLGARMEGSDPSKPPPMDMMMPPASVMALGPALMLFYFLYYLLLASFEAGCLRWLIRGETGGLVGLTLGADTWRVYFSYWVWFFLMIGAVIVLFLGIGAIAMASGSSEGPEGVFGLIAVGLALLWLAGLIYFAVRFAPAAATSIARRRFAFFDSWTVSKGRFLALLGAFAMLFVMYIVAYLIISAVAGMAMVGGMASQASTMSGEPTPEQVFAMFAVPSVLIPLIVIYLLAIVGSFLWLIATYGVNARAARAALEEGKITAAA